jgi:hypothetical protein
MRVGGDVALTEFVSGGRVSDDGVAAITVLDVLTGWRVLLCMLPVSKIAK